MVRVVKATPESLMTASQVAEFLLESCKSLSGFESYMFGSSLTGLGVDFDILIVGQSGDRLTLLNSELKIAGKELPLDVLYMLQAEAKETGFVNRVGCVALSQLAKTSIL